ncbi:MAG: hypothetical protein KGN98_09110 [Alphaproteobacteria bacterium]|nr:hypothetical protein [Alphaproteobacteria bacterium]
MATTDNNSPKTPAKKAPARRKTAATATATKRKTTAVAKKAAAPAAQSSLRDEAGKMMTKLKSSARDAANTGKDKTTNTLDDVSALVDDVARTLEERVGPQYGAYARRAADALSGVSDSLKAKDIEDLLEDARDFIRRKPAVAIGAAAALGFVVTRLLAADQGDEA